MKIAFSAPIRPARRWDFHELVLRAASGLHAGGISMSSFSKPLRPARRWDLKEHLLRATAGMHAGEA